MLSCAESRLLAPPRLKSCLATSADLLEQKGISAGENGPSLLSVFSGLGGLDIGLEAAGFRVVGCIEKDPLARESLSRNRPSWRLVEPADVVEYAKVADPAHFGLRRKELGLLAGGPPCQPFSKAAQWHETARAGLKDPRSNCFGSFLALVRVFLPRVVLIENVQGFAGGKTSALPFLQETLDRINAKEGVLYEADSRVLDACDFGIPQHRRRSIIVCFRGGEEFDWPEPTHVDDPIRAWDAIGDLHATHPPKAQGRWADLLPSIPEGENYLYHTPEGKGEQLFGYRTRYWSFLLKLAKNRPAWTLPAQPSQNCGPFHWDNRRLTWKEMLRLQSFPRGWKVAGKYDARVRQIGNSTPPLLAEVLGRALAEQVFRTRFAHRPKLALHRRRRVPPAHAILAVPGRYLTGIGSVAPHPGPGLGPGALRSAKGMTPKLSRSRSVSRSSNPQ